MFDRAGGLIQITAFFRPHRLRLKRQACYVVKEERFAPTRESHSSTDKAGVNGAPRVGGVLGEDKTTKLSFRPERSGVEKPAFSSA